MREPVRRLFFMLLLVGFDSILFHLRVAGLRRVVDGDEVAVGDDDKALEGLVVRIQPHELIQIRQADARPVRHGQQL